MNILQAIEVRKSRRTYLPTPIEPRSIALLKSRIEEYNIRSGLTIRFLENGKSAFAGIRKSYGLFKGVRSLFVMKGPKSVPHLKEKIGYYGELLVLEATVLGLGTCWVGGTFDKNSIRTALEEEFVCVITVGNVPEQETKKERLIYKVIHRKTKTIQELLEITGDCPTWLKRGMKAVQKAPSTRNTQKVRFLYEQGNLYAQVPETYPFDLVDLGIAKLHFELAAGGRFAAGNGGKLLSSEKSQA